MKEFAAWFYRSAAWRKCRNSYFKYRNGLCERCPSAGRIVHHKVYITPKNINDPEVTLAFDNLELLCQDCHNKEHFEVQPIRDGLTFDEKGNLILNPFTESPL